MLKRILDRIQWRTLIYCGIGLWIALCASDLYYDEYNELMFSPAKVFPTTSITHQVAIDTGSALTSISRFIEKGRKSWGTIRKSRILTTFVVIIVSIWSTIFAVCIQEYRRKKECSNKEYNSDKKTSKNTGIQVSCPTRFISTTLRYEKDDKRSSQEWFSTLNTVLCTFKEEKNEHKITDKDSAKYNKEIHNNSNNERDEHKIECLYNESHRFQCEPVFQLVHYINLSRSIQFQSTLLSQRYTVSIFNTFSSLSVKYLFNSLSLKYSSKRNFIDDNNKDEISVNKLKVVNWFRKKNKEKSTSSDFASRGCSEIESVSTGVFQNFITIMGTLKYLLFALLCNLIVRTGKCSDMKLDQFLNEKWTELKINIAKSQIRTSEKVFVNNYNVSWSRSWSTEWGVDSPVTINTFNKMLLAHRNGSMEISIDISNSNRASELKKDIVIVQENCRPIKFVRTIKWKTTLYLLICYDTGSCSLYTGNDISNLIHRQNIRHRGYLMDACFFTKANRLYLIVVNNLSYWPVPSVIYHWAGTYMDIVTEITTTSAVSVTTFKYKQSIIIVFAQRVNADPPIVSNVYEFKETGIETIQFLPTHKPISVHHYSYNNYNFVLMVNEQEVSTAYLWDGTELLKWIDIPEIKANYFMQTVYLQDGTYFIVAHDNVVELFKLYSTTNYASLSTRKLDDERNIVDMHALVHDTSVKIILTTLSRGGVYSVETWDLNLKNKTSYENSKMVTDSSQKCLSDIIGLLQTRKSIIDKFQSFWPYSESSLENDFADTNTLKFPNVVLKSGVVKKIDLFVEDEVLTPVKLREHFDDLNSKIESLSKNSLNILRPDAKNNLYGTINIDGDAFFKEMHIDTVFVDKLNNVDYNSLDLISLKDDQQFESSLRAENITVQDLKVDSLCGIPNQYWATTDDKDWKILVSEQDSTRELSGNSILVHSNITIPNLRVKKMNDTDMDELIDQFFVIGGNQTITGNITYNYLEAKNLTTKIYNKSPSILLMTREDDQDFYEFSMKTLETDALRVEFINGIAISEVAMKSRENVIEGEVTLNNMEVTEIFNMDPAAKISTIPPSQIYDDVQITGDITVKTFNFQMNAKLTMDNLEVQPDAIFDNMWTKSSNQTIRNDISLDSGATIDRLDTKYLNGFAKEEFLYTTAEKIPEIFTNLHFENLHVNDAFHREGKNLNNFDVHQDRIKIYGDLRVQRAQLNNLIADNYNDIPVGLILNNTGGIKVSKNVDLPTISTQRAIVQDLNFHFLNDRAVSPYLNMPIKINDSFELGSIVTPEFHAEEILVNNFNGTDISYLIELKNATIEDIVNEIIIDDDLVLSENLTAKIIDHYSVELFLEKIATEDISFSTGMKDKLTVQNITMDFLYGFKVDTLPSSVFSKTSSQKIPGRFSFQKIRAKNMEAKYVNDKDTSKLTWIDESLVFSGNLTFIDLFVDNDVSTGSLNGYNVGEIYPSPLTIHSTKILNLDVDGHISWKNPKNDSKSLSHLFKKAVRRDKPQTIQGNTTFTKKLHVMSFTGNVEGIDEIRNIVQDTVFANSPKISLGGEKIFKNNLTVNTLKTGNMIDIETINDVNMVELNASIVDKYQENVVKGSIIFTDEVIVDQLLFNDTLHETSNTDLVLSTQALPNDTYIENLVVLGNIFLMTIDGVDFNKFVEDRVTLSENHVISSDVQFQGRVESTGNAAVKNINGIRTFDLVINGLQTTQIISGAKILTNDLTVKGNVESPLVNNVNITDEFSNSVLNDENVTIIGDVIFESYLDMPKNIIVSGLVNGVNVSKFLNNLDGQQSRSISSLKENEKFIENTIKEKALVVRSLPSIFSYLEIEDHLKIEVPTVKKIDVIVFGSTVKFNLYGEQTGDSCGLPRDCSCPLQYIAELTEKDCRVWRRNETFTLRNFHEPNNLFGIDVTTSTVSYNARCTRNKTDSEFTAISWMTNEKYKENDIFNARYSDIQVKGFLKDARAFTNNDQVYLALAIYYDPTAKTHYTNSSIYKLSLENDSLSLHQEIPTDGASAIEVFKINYSTYIVIACDGDTMGSLIYKLNSNNSMFDLLKKLPGRSNSVKSLSNDEDYFVMINDVNTNALNIYVYDHKSDNFYNYQSFFHDSRINEIQTFYTGDIGQSDAYAIVTTEDGQFYVYEYMFAGKFQRKIVHQMDGIQTMVPFYYEQRHYIICGARTNTTIMRIVQQGLH
ncbi:hypothetical protein KPH14_005365 [Odynerus spinipes]|uniref:Uncharacterized protein n=1 Tax=Odynerus spinipes TaxID=1348599 RepID=A0AAD9VJ70_9HYME|nr:hypothetical protein KPH14_005365 [Odynerus spinipes]